MPFDYFVTGAIAQELNTALAGGKIERVYMPERSEIMLHVNAPPQNERARSHYDLLVSAQSGHPLIYLATKRSGNPQNPPAFCMLLRKHLIGARVERVYRVDSERIIRMETDATDELGAHRRRTLVFEIMGKHSNIILLDENETILDAIKRVYADMSRVRQILPGMRYTLPPPGKGISPLMEEETAGPRDRAYYEALARDGRYDPLIWLDEAGRMKDFHVFDLNVYSGLKTSSFPTISAMLEAYFEGKESGNRLQQKTVDLRRTLKARIDKLYLKKQRLLEDIKKAEGADVYRQKGELITANIYRMKGGAKEISLPDFTDGTETRITLDPRLSPSENAQRYFKKYSKAKTALIAKREQLDIAQHDIDFLESYLVYIDNATTDSDIDALRDELTALGFARRRGRSAAPRGTRPAYLKYESSAGRTIFVGRNNRENDELTLKRAAKNDLWLHTKDIPGSHVILKRAEGQDAPGMDGFDAQSIREAAALSAHYSKGRMSESVPVDYCLVKYVKKPAGAKPGMVIFTHNRTLYVKPGLPPSQSDRD
jgi:predicted ribosome quality control (RQC) complex YloA/Tae2 family protein